MGLVPGNVWRAPGEGHATRGIAVANGSDCDGAATPWTLRRAKSSLEHQLRGVGAQQRLSRERYFPGVCDEVLVDPGGGLLVTAESLPEANRSHGSPRK